MKQNPKPKLFTKKRNITTHLKKLRVFKGIYRREMAELLGITENLYRFKYEETPKEIPHKEVRDKICAKLGFNEKQIWPTIEEDKK